MDAKPKHRPHQTNRRAFILGGVALAVSAAASTNLLAASDDHTQHHHHASRNSDLINAAIDCVTQGQLCRDHCIELVKIGDTSIADCLDVVTDTISMCKTLTQLAISHSPHLKTFAQVCMNVCKDCEKECLVHKDKHKECKDCMESCAKCIEQLEKLVA